MSFPSSFAAKLDKLPRMDSSQLSCFPFVLSLLSRIPSAGATDPIDVPTDDALFTILTGSLVLRVSSGFQLGDDVIKGIKITEINN